MNIWKLAPIATLISALLAPLSGAAVSLGEINMQSYLGDPFRATIPLQISPNEEVDITCLSLAPPPPAEGMVYLRHARLSLSKQGGTWQLLISGSNALNEPYISVVIQSGCQEQGRVVREYTVLVDPASFTSPPQAMEEKPATVEGKPTTGEHSALPTSNADGAPSPSRANTDHAVRTIEKRATPAVARKKPVKRAAPPKDRLKVISGVGEAPARPEQTEKERLQLREKELTRELDDKTAQFLAMQAQLATLEAKMAEMQKTITLQNKMMAAMQKPAVTPQKPAYNWKDYWPAGPVMLIAGMVYFLASRSRKRSLENWQPTNQSR